MAYFVSGPIIQVEDAKQAIIDFAKYFGVYFMTEKIEHLNIMCARCEAFELVEYRRPEQKIIGPAQCWYVNVGCNDDAQFEEKIDELVDAGYQVDCLKREYNWFDKYFFKDVDGIPLGVATQCGPEPFRSPEEMANFKFDTIALCYPIN